MGFGGPLTDTRSGGFAPENGSIFLKKRFWLLGAPFSALIHHRDRILLDFDCRYTKFVKAAMSLLDGTCNVWHIAILREAPFYFR